MLLKPSESVEVGMSNAPKWVRWKARVYKIKKIGLHHTYRKGLTLYHVFSVVTDTLFMRLVLNTDNLLWKLEEVADTNN